MCLCVHDDFYIQYKFDIPVRRRKRAALIAAGVVVGFAVAVIAGVSITSLVKVSALEEW